MVKAVAAELVLLAEQEEILQVTEIHLRHLGLLTEKIGIGGIDW